jgi:hypothetical protein
MTELLVNLDFAEGGNTASCLIDGWGEQEPTMRWSMGRQSRLRLPVTKPGPGCVLVINATPCIHPPALCRQAVMLALDGRLLALASFAGLGVYGFRVPESMFGAGAPELSITHLHHDAPRAEEQMRDDQPLCLAVHSIRLYRLDPRQGGWHPADPPQSPADLAGRFESLGQGCHFGLIQRELGAEPLSLLRFTDTVTSCVAEGLVRGFEGVDSPESLTLFQTDRDRPTYAWEQIDYGLTFDTRQFVDETDPKILVRDQARRLKFLRRKFLDGLRSGEKIYVLTRSDCLTEPEALAVYCALTLYGPNTLLWTVFGDEQGAGRVERLAPGYLRGELGLTDIYRYAPVTAWHAVLKAAWALSQERAWQPAAEAGWPQPGPGTEPLVLPGSGRPQRARQIGDGLIDQ